MKARAWALATTLVTAFLYIVISASEATAGKCSPYKCKPDQADACLQGALTQLSDDSAASCVEVRVTPAAGESCKADVTVKVNGKDTADKSKCETGGLLAFELNRKDLGEGNVTVALASALTSKDFSAKAVVPAKKPPSEAGAPAVVDAGTQGKPAATATPEGGALVPVDVPPRNFGVNAVPDIEWSRGTLDGGAYDPDRCNDSTLGTRRRETSYFREACRQAVTDPSTVALTDVVPTAPAAVPGAVVFTVDEDLAVRADAPHFVTESDTVVVRFLVRKALACRIRAEADGSNHYDASTFRVGGQAGVDKIVPPGLIFTAAEGGDKKQYSCEKELLPLSTSQAAPAQYTPKDGEYTYVDFRFGPFSNDEIVIHLRRRDRTLSHVDMEAVLKIPNHKRYNGWFDVTLGGNWLFAPARTVEAVPQGGSPLYRLGTNDTRIEYDVAIIVKAYAWCFDRRPWFQPVDVKDATACLAIGGGLSIAHPLRTFYPFGTSVQVGQFFSAHLMLSLNRYEGLASGYQVGDVYSGDPGAVPTKDRYVLGAGFGFGVDPTLFATLLKGLVTGK